MIADVQGVEQVFQNLLSNAVKYADGHRPEVMVLAEHEEDGNWRVDVIDNGLGVPAEGARADLRAVHAGPPRRLRRDGSGPLDLPADRHAARREHRRRGRAGRRESFLVPAADRPVAT